MHIRHAAFQSSVQEDEVSLRAGLWECSVILATFFFLNCAHEIRGKWQVLSLFQQWF